MDWLDTLHALVGREDGDITWQQMSLRAAIIFIYGLVLLRIAHKRVLGKWTALDFVLSIIIGSNLSRALTGSAPFVPTLIATTVLIALHTLLVDLAARFEPLGPLLKGRPAKLIADGVVDRRAMRRHAVGEHDLQEALRSSGVTDPTQVREAYLERGGEISVIKR